MPDDRQQVFDAVDDPETAGTSVIGIELESDIRQAQLTNQGFRYVEIGQEIARIIPCVDRLDKQLDSVLAEPLGRPCDTPAIGRPGLIVVRSEEHTSELQSLMRISYAVFCLK